MSLHPPNMTDSKGRLLPTSFIPFCAYQSNVLGLFSPNFPFTSCILTQNTVLDGQLCYSFNVSAFSTQVLKKGRHNGLMMLLDFGPTKNKKIQTNLDSEWRKESKRINRSKKDQDSVRVFVQTLSRFSSYETGSFAMSSLQKMIGTESFLDFPDGIKKCQVEDLEECLTSAFFRSIKERCGCIPWGLDKLRAEDSGVSHSVVWATTPTPGGLLHCGGPPVCD